MSKSRLVKLALIIFGFFALAVTDAQAYTCNGGVGDYCMGTRTLDWYTGCHAEDPDQDTLTPNSYCQQNTIQKTKTCDSDWGVCKYSNPYSPLCI